MIKIKSYSTTIEAELAKRFLEAEGVKAVISGSDPMRPYLEWSMGVDLFIEEKDIERARDILEIRVE